MTAGPTSWHCPFNWVCTFFVSIMVSPWPGKPFKSTLGIEALCSFIPVLDVQGECIWYHFDIRQICVAENQDMCLAENQRLKLETSTVLQAKTYASFITVSSTKLRLRPLVPFFFCIDLALIRTYDLALNTARVAKCQLSSMHTLCVSSRDVHGV